MFLSASAALRDLDSRAYDGHRIAQGKRHNHALLALARRRSDVLYVMLRDGTLLQPPAERLSGVIGIPMSGEWFGAVPPSPIRGER